MAARKISEAGAAGRFEYEIFDPQQWVPDYPNAAFANENPGDRLWAARKIMAFTDEEIRAIVSTGQYTDPAAGEWIVRCLIERRNKIVRAFVSGTGAIDGFALRENGLEFHVAGSAPKARIQWSVFNNNTLERRPLPGAASFDLPQQKDGAQYLVAEIAGDSGPRISVYVSLKQGQPRIVGVERNFAADKKEQAWRR